MVNRSVSVGIHLTPREAEAELWEMDAVQQVDFMLAIARRFQVETGNVLMQMQAISDEMDELLKPDERKAIIRVIEQLFEYIKSTDKDEYELIDCGNGCYERRRKSHD